MDARALLRATKGAAAVASSTSNDTQSRSGKGAIPDRFASYNSKTGSLRCAACSYITIKHENLWTSHAASKSHRQNVAAILAKEEKEAEERRRNAEQEELTAKSSLVGEKRKASDQNGVDLDDANVGEETKKQKLAATASTSTPLDPASEAAWRAFQQEIFSASTSTSATADQDYKNFAAATIEAAPVLRRRNGDEEDEDPVEEEQPLEKTEEELEEERRQKKEREEKEEIMERYEEEVRIQQEANERVAALRDRLERIRNSRKQKGKASADG